MDELTPISSRSTSPLPKFNSIPDSLSFDKIIAGGTCPPMTCRDFMRYLTYVEHSAENLQFYLWLRDYSARFEALPDNEKALSPEIAPYSQFSDVNGFNTNNTNSANRPTRLATKFFADAFLIPNAHLKVPPQTKGNPFTTPPGSQGSSNNLWGSGTDSGSITGIDHAAVTADAFQAVDLKWQPFTIQPFREEITRMIAIYVAEGSPRELNVSARDRVVALRALAQTTHPSALDPLKKAVESTLRHQAHPNFIRWSVRNGNECRVVFALWLGTVVIAAGFIVAILLTLSNRPRGYRAFAAIAWLIGISTLFAATKGMCVVLHGLHHRHVHPWELWSDENALEMNVESKSSFDSKNSSNSYEDEPWVARYANRNIIQKIFDKEVWIEEPALKQIQDAIFVQSIIIAAIVSAIIAGIFVALPSGGYFH
ncbi:uncharacterized protein LAJ45_02373 [Morchella importuna]|uniref:RGS domain-containing protein n=1 Tax=Morchella conica CCBAS932 TaxID=1392247 RepID=A0A3N4KVZ0_9PEZI|nr:uncharacterized protein LAJ45_02373 [Morchella importuna]KAH8153560.1 hypothetical protein LAJ45_02373 [Morchella importuna]RPB14716.1 hypothetical protein P167DRAFT_572014 [Morchella conica CCBAS932]